ncbi:MFS transporter [Bacillus cereus]|uniref:MFS transporter n=1 Tax=Bacillus cereus TaxID=1396 RepID=UPI002AC03B08|nr:MFS transporter [Bacillus cereus]MDZ4407634.1 MFS transporter [Bacillus cereus]MDZ4534169.1 MFS transporter [Bacillus cereus]
MNGRVYLLTIVSFVVGLVEMILGGILPLIADDLGVPLGQAGILISVFSLTFAIAGPLLLSATARVERKQLMLLTLLVTLLANMIAVLSTSYAMLLVARIISAMGAALLISLCVTIASHISAKTYRARAISFVLMGVSASLVLGVPFGLMLGNAFGWRAPFGFIVALTAISILCIYLLLGKIAPKPSVSFKAQLQALKKRKIILIQLTSILFFGGNLTLYAYFTPFLQRTLSLDGNWISVMYLIVGISAIIGGGIGGLLSDRIGPKKTITTVISLFAVSIFILPFTTFNTPLFLIVMIIWSMMSWALQPAIQSYLIVSAPDTSDIQQSLNNSAAHVGMALGASIGGIVIERLGVEMNAVIGGILVVVALFVALASMQKKKQKTDTKSKIV